MDGEAFGAVVWALAWGRSRLGLASFSFVIETTEGSAGKGRQPLAFPGLTAETFL